MTITGKLLQTTGVEQISDTFKKTNLIIQTDYETQYPQEVSIEVHNDNIAKIAASGAKPGDVVNVEVNLRGRKYSKDGQPDRWFNSFVFWRMEKVSGNSTPEYAPPVDLNSKPDDDNSDLPF